MAYPINNRNVDQERLLIKTFACGLASDAIAAKLVEDEPNTLEHAVVLVAQACSRQDVYSRLGRQIREEQPMDISASDRGKLLGHMVASLTSTMQHLAMKIAKLEARDNRATTDRPARGIARSPPMHGPGPPPDRRSSNRPACPGNDRRRHTEGRPAGQQHLPPRHADFQPSYPAGPCMIREPRCYACGKTGHFTVDCLSRQGFYTPHKGNDRMSWQ